MNSINLYKPFACKALQDICNEETAFTFPLFKGMK